LIKKKSLAQVSTTYRIVFFAVNNLLVQYVYSCASLLWLHGRSTTFCFRSELSALYGSSLVLYAQDRGRAAASFVRRSVRPSVRQFALVVTRWRGVFHDLERHGRCRRPAARQNISSSFRRDLARLTLPCCRNAKPALIAGRARRIDRYCGSGRAIDQSQRAVCSVVTAAARGARTDDDATAVRDARSSGELPTPSSM